MIEHGLRQGKNGIIGIANKGDIMRVFTKEQYEALQSNKIYRMIMDAPPPDFTFLYKEAETFARWIAREHRKERMAMQKELA